MIAPVATPEVDLSFPGLNPGTGNRERGTIPIDALWSCLRDLADELLRSRAVALGRPVDESARGGAYVFIADLIAGWVDRAERGETRGDGLDADRLLEEGMTRLWLRINGSGR